MALGVALPRLKSRLGSGSPVSVVAIGSSSTRGVGASNEAATYPEVMQRELSRLRPSVRFKIVNSGSNGETIPGQLARLERDALAAKPDLVIWQLGANDVIQRLSSVPPELEQQIVEGVRRIREAGAEVILMDLQNAPVVTRAVTYRPMLQTIESAARRSGAGLFRRFALLESAVSAGVSLAELTSPDSLHSNDAAYDCVGRTLARSIDVAAR